MKTLLTILIMAFLGISLNAQHWTELSPVPDDGRIASSAFAINGKGYVCLGFDLVNNFNDLWEYEVETDTWTQKADFPGIPRRSTVVFVFDSVAYVGLGTSGTNSHYDFFKYSPVTNSWTEITTYPGIAGRNSTATTFKGKGYVGGGSETSYLPYNDDFYVFDPVLEEWTNLGVFPFGNRANAVAFTSDSLIYYGLGQDGIHDFNDFWAYNPQTGIWKEVSSFPGDGRINAAFVELENYFIVGGGYRLGIGDELSDYYMYDPGLDSWTPIEVPDTLRRAQTSSFTIDGVGYLCEGMNINNTALSDIWKFDLFNECTVIDTVEIYKTIEVFDTIYEYVTVEVFDTIYHTITDTSYQTVYTIDTLYVTETVYDYVSVSDTLIFDALIDDINPPNTLTLIKVYPNPAKDILYVEFGNPELMINYKLKIINQTGSVVYETNVQDNLYNLDLSEWSGYGLYYLQIINSNNDIISNKKILLE